VILTDLVDATEPSTPDTIMKIHTSLVPLTALMLALASCSKDSAPPSTPGEPSAVAAETSPALDDPPNCQSTYSVVGAVRSGTLSESIGGVVFTDDSPFQCTLRSASQNVVFAFNDSSTDPSNQCQYTLGYMSGGSVFSGTQTLSCNASSLEFTATATLVAGQPTSCPQVPPDDPKIVLTTKNCGGGIDD
jgi:hypothetical protein